MAEYDHTFASPASQECHNKRQRLREAHICICCGQRPASEGLACNECKERTNKKQAVRRALVKNSGICIRCLVNMVQLGKRHCSTCLEVIKENSRRRNQMLKSKGICIKCRIRPISKGTVCEECRIAVLEATRKREIHPKCTRCGKHPVVARRDICAFCIADDLQGNTATCQSCGSPTITGMSICFKCASEVNRSWNEAIRSRICPCCGSKEFDDNKRCCPKCAADRKERAETNIPLHKCPCGNPLTNGDKRCLDCKAKYRLCRSFYRSYGFCDRCGESFAVQGSVYCEKCGELFRDYANQKNRRIKEEVIAEMGGKCYCCSDPLVEMLTIDHVNMDGAAHRRQLRKNGENGGYSMFPYIKKHHLEHDPNYRLACISCNTASFRNGGVCPHEAQRLLANTFAAGSGI